MKLLSRNTITNFYELKKSISESDLSKSFPVVQYRLSLKQDWMNKFAMDICKSEVPSLIFVGQVSMVNAKTMEKCCL